MRTMVRALLLAPLFLTALLAQAYAQKTKAQLSTEVSTTFPDNNIGSITPSGVRTFQDDLINSIMPTAPVTSGNLACWNGTTGLLQDCGSAPSTVPLTVGTTPIGSGATGSVLYDNNGKLGELTSTQLTSIVNLATSVTSGALPAWPNDTAKFFRGDGSYVTLNCAALAGVAASCGTDATNASNISSGTLSGSRYAAVNLAAGNVNGGVTGALPFANLPTGTIDTVLGYWGSTAVSAIAVGNCANSLTYSTASHTFGCNVSAGTGTVTSAQISAGDSVTVATTAGANPCVATCNLTVALDPAAGQWRLLATLTAAVSANLSDTTHFTSSYKDYEIVLENLLPATNSTDCQIQVQVGGTFQTTTYLSVVTRSASSATSTTSLTTNIPCSGSGGQVSNAGQGISGILTMLGPVSGTSVAKISNGQFTYINAGGQAEMAVSGGYYNSGGAVTGARVAFSSGNITSGTMKIYGRN